MLRDFRTLTKPAAQRAGLTVKGQVNHSKWFRDPATGVHSNDIESEWARFKLWYRRKFAYMRASNHTSHAKRRQLLEDHVVEYVYYTNVGQSMGAVMKAFVGATKRVHHVAGV